MYQVVLVVRQILDNIHVQYDQFNEDGVEFGAVSLDDAQRIIRVLDKVKSDILDNHQVDDYAVDSTSKRNAFERSLNEIVPTNMQDVGFLLTPFITNNSYFESIINESVRRSDSYSNIALTSGGNRFDHARVHSAISKKWREQSSEPAPPTTETTPPVEVVVDPIIENIKKLGRPPLKVDKAGDYSVIYYSLDYGAYVTGDELLAMAGILKKNILVFSSINDARKRLDKNLFKDYIFLYCNPSIESSKYNLSRIDTTNVNEQPCLGYRMRNCFIPKTENGTTHISTYDQVIRDTKTGIVFALRKGNDIFIMVIPKEREFYDRMYKEITRRAFRNLSKNLIEIDNRYNEDLIKKDKENYVDFVVKNANAYIEDMQSQLRSAIDEIGSLQRQLAEKMKAYKQFNEIIDKFDVESHKAKMAIKAKQDLEDVEKLPQVQCVFIKDDKLNIMTNTIIVTDDGSKKKYNIGRFHIQLNMLSGRYSSDEDAIRIRNIERPLVGGMSGTQDAPHVFSGGHLCQGNISTTVIECYSNRDVYGLVSALIFFLESANTSDGAGQHLVKWPEYVEAKEIIDEVDEEFEKLLEKGTK